MTTPPNPILSSANVLKVTARHAEIRRGTVQRLARLAESQALIERMNRAPEAARRTEAQRDVLRTKIISNPNYQKWIQEVVKRERLVFNEQAGRRIRRLPDGFRLDSITPGLVVLTSNFIAKGSGSDPDRPPLFVDLQAKSGKAGEPAALSRRYAYPTEGPGEQQDFYLVETPLLPDDTTILSNVVEDIHRLNGLLVRDSRRR